MNDFPAPSRLCLNLGCGRSPRPSTTAERWINVDAQALPGVNCVRDLRRGLPYADATVDHVFLDNVLEHFANEDAIFLLNEIGRVLRPGGTAEIIVPDARSQGAYQDPTHRSQWVPRSALYWSARYTPFGGPFVGITADFVVDAVESYGDMATEAFVRFRVRKGER